MNKERRKKLKNIYIKLKGGDKADTIKDFYFDAYHCIRYCSKRKIEEKNDKDIIISTIHVIPLSNIREITFDEEIEFED